MTQDIAWSEEVWSPDYDPTTHASVLDYPVTGICEGIYPAESDIDHRGPRRVWSWAFRRTFGYTPYGGDR